MKLAAIVLTATVAVALAETTPYCDVAALLKVVQTEHSQDCYASTGFNVAVSKAATADNAAKICPETTCQAVLADTKDTFKTDCLTVNNIPVLAAVVKPSEEACAKFSTPVCDTATMLKVVTSDNARLCAVFTGFGFTAAKPLKADDAAKVCSEKTCQDLLVEARDTVKTECLALGITPFLSEVLKPTEEVCTKYLADLIQTCDTATLLKIVQSENARACTAKTGFSVAATKPVTAENAAAICPEKSCQTLFTEVKDTVRTECLALGITPLLSGVIKPSEALGLRQVRRGKSYQLIVSQWFHS